LILLLQVTYLSKEQAEDQVSSFFIERLAESTSGDICRADGYTCVKSASPEALMRAQLLTQIRGVEAESMMHASNIAGLVLAFYPVVIVQQYQLSYYFCHVHAFLGVFFLFWGGRIG
jgi:hypothetical protein